VLDGVEVLLLFGVGCAVAGGPLLLLELLDLWLVRKRKAKNMLRMRKRSDFELFMQALRDTLRERRKAKSE